MQNRSVMSTRWSRRNSPGGPKASKPPTERLIGSIRRVCVDHVVVLGERHLYHLLQSYLKYYNETRTHLSLDKDAPIPRAVEAVGRILSQPPRAGRIASPICADLICDRHSRSLVRVINTVDARSRYPRVR